MFRKFHETREKGFTLVELLVVIGIIGILALLLLPQFRGMRDRARVASCQSNLKNIGTQLEVEYVDKDSYPNETDGDWTDLITTGTGALAKLSFCGADRSPYEYVETPTAASLAVGANGVSLTPAQAAAPGAGEAIMSYAVYCTFHDGSSVIFPESVQLMVTQDGMVRNDRS